MLQPVCLTATVPSAKNLKNGDNRVFNFVKGRKDVTMIYYDQLTQCTARISQLLNFSLAKYVTRKYSIVAKVHTIVTCIFTYEITLSTPVSNTLNDCMSTEKTKNITM